MDVLKTNLTGLPLQRPLPYTVRTFFLLQTVRMHFPSRRVYACYSYQNTGEEYAQSSAGDRQRSPLEVLFLVHIFWLTFLTLHRRSSYLSLVQSVNTYMYCKINIMIGACLMSEKISYKTKTIAQNVVLLQDK